ncbi:MAG: hypothetical protein R3C44_05770 [Chloroflexota bacterium]
MLGGDKLILHARLPHRRLWNGYRRITAKRSNPHYFIVCMLWCAGFYDRAARVAWPSIRSDFNLPLDALAAVLISSTIGFAAGSFVSGSTISRRGPILFLMVSCGLAAMGLFGYALAPGWGTFVALGLIAGLGSGLIDTGLNILVAGSQSVRTMELDACLFWRWCGDWATSHDSHHYQLV